MNTQPRTVYDDLLAVSSPPRRFSLDVPEAAFVVFLLLVFVTLSPFATRVAAAGPGGAGTGSGDTLRQVSYLLALAVIGTAAYMRRGLQAFTAVPVLLNVLLAWCVLSALWADQPGVAFRRAGLAIVVVWSVMMSIENIGIARTLQLLRWVLAGVLIVNWLSIPLIPQAIHLSNDFEPEIVGDWRGLFYHKNIAGSVCATTAILYLFHAIETRRRTDMLLCAAAVGFLIMTVSKTSMGLLPVALGLGAIYGWHWRNALDRHIAMVAAALILLLCTVGLMAEWDTVVRLLEDPQQFTGRAAIWQAEFAFIRDHPLLGAGFGTFTDTGARSPLYNYISAAWVATVAQGHSGYLQLFVTIGTVGFFLGMAALIVQPLIMFLSRVRIDPALGRLLFTLFCFGVLHNVMESDFLEGDGPQWVVFLLTLAMLRLAYRDARRREGAADPWRMR